MAIYRYIRWKICSQQCSVIICCTMSKWKKEEERIKAANPEPASATLLAVEDHKSDSSCAIKQ